MPTCEEKLAAAERERDEARTRVKELEAAVNDAADLITLAVADEDGIDGSGAEAWFRKHLGVPRVGQPHAAPAQGER